MDNQNKSIGGPCPPCSGCSSAFLKSALLPFFPLELRQLKTPVFEQSGHGGCCDVDAMPTLPIANDDPFDIEEPVELEVDERPWGAGHPVSFTGCTTKIDRIHPMTPEQERRFEENRKRLEREFLIQEIKDFGKYLAVGAVAISAIASASWLLMPEAWKDTVKNRVSYALDYFKEPADDNAGGLGGENVPTFTGTGIETSSAQTATQYFGSGKTQTHILEGFRFASGQSSIDNPPMDTIDVLGMLHNSGECSGYQLHGYTDSVGGEESNRSLSLARASFIQTVLVENTDIALESVSVFGHGEDNPLRTNNTAEGRAQNRRVEIVCNPS